MGSALVALSPEWMPIFCDPIVHSVNIIGNQLVPSIILSTGDASENMFSKAREQNWVHAEHPTAPGQGWYCSPDYSYCCPISLSSSSSQEP